MDDLISFLRDMLAADERVALLALKGHNIGDPADMPPELRAARWWVDYERISVIVDDQHREMCTVGPGANWHAATHIYIHQPRRVLDEVEAKREIINVCAAEIAGNVNPSAIGNAEFILRLMGTPYSEHPGYQESWRP